MTVLKAKGQHMHKAALQQTADFHAGPQHGHWGTLLTLGAEIILNLGLRRSAVVVGDGQMLKTKALRLLRKG